MWDIWQLAAGPQLGAFTRGSPTLQLNRTSVFSIGHVGFRRRQCRNWLWVESLANEIGGLDFVTIIYVLSAIDRTHMQRAVQRLARLLKVGGLLFFRDYAAGDMAQHRFDARGAKNKLDSETYARGLCSHSLFQVSFPVTRSGAGEGTLAHYFTHDEIRSLFEHDGMLEQKQLITVRLLVPSLQT